ncbi:recombinase family protein [Bermanella sp. WJH001]|uniref:recombinase family protein n=1 Tax=Bermanella sp. WJH001 TaxID=3048005 RepID=UPI0024BEE6CF|nr:recombinase family protein [Bermanella sp. WJH001]MDJ1538927.1 recombinase family protein [Bermanella sp. WJH001]
MGKKLAIPYIRMSTEEQLKGDSLRRQSELINTYAKENDLEVDWTTNYTDIGKSAYTGKNLAKEAGLGRFLGAVQAGVVKSGTALLIESLDRLSRKEVKTALKIILGILENGIEIHVLGEAEKTVYTEESDEKDLIIAIIILSRANRESKIKQERLSKSWENKRRIAEEEKKPITKRIPAWLEVRDGKFQVNQEKGEVVQRIIKMKLDGYGSNKIAYILNSEEVPVFGRGKKWHESYIKKIISNKALLGVYTAQKLDQDGNKEFVKEIGDYYPKLISKDDFNRINIKRDNKGRKSAYFSNLFTGIAKCKKCGSSMVMINKGSDSKGGKYLICSNVKTGKKGEDGRLCDNKASSYKDFERIILSHLDSLDIENIIDPDINNETVEEIKELELQISNITTVLNNIQKSIDESITENKGVVSSYLIKRETELTVELNDFKDQFNTKKIELNKSDLSRNNFYYNFKEIVGENYILRAKTNIELKLIIESMKIEVHGSYNKKVSEVDITLIGGYRIILLIDKNFLDNKENKVLTIPAKSDKPLKQRDLHLRESMNIFKTENSMFHNFKSKIIKDLTS